MTNSGIYIVVVKFEQEVPTSLVMKLIGVTIRKYNGDESFNGMGRHVYLFS